MAKDRWVISFLIILLLVLSLAGCAVSLQEGVSEGEEVTREEGAAAEDSYADDNHTHELSNYPCGPAYPRWWPEPSTDHLSWTPNGEHIVFSFFTNVPSRSVTTHALHIVDVHGSRLRLVVDASTVGQYYGMPYGLYADISPDGDRIVYTSCEFPKAGRQRNAGEKRAPADYNYEIAVINLDGFRAATAL